MDIKRFVELNVERCYSPEARTKWGNTSERDLVDWALCVAGEAGELCNAVKKFQIYARDVNEHDKRRREVLSEAADTITYCFLLMYQLSVASPQYVEDMLLSKFNEVSDRIGWKSGEELSCPF